ncbi:MAG: UDP-glucose 6-dehydrogenase, partial [Candidatus Levybacteria bacterium]|nr:UDP-glucose 6-dehydrogenase [Candidatus Levybacteria bacterium]
LKKVVFCANPYEVAKDADILIVMTEWNEFQQLDLQKVKQIMKTAIILDGRNIYDPQKVKKAGFVYQGVGR